MTDETKGAGTLGYLRRNVDALMARYPDSEAAQSMTKLVGLLESNWGNPDVAMASLLTLTEMAVAASPALLHLHSLSIEKLAQSLGDPRIKISHRTFVMDEGEGVAGEAAPLTPDEREHAA